VCLQVNQREIRWQCHERTLVMSIVGFKNLKQSRIEVRNHDAPGPLNREWGYTMTPRGKVERTVKSALCFIS
jgi:hypothetical protein